MGELCAPSKEGSMRHQRSRAENISIFGKFDQPEKGGACNNE